MYEKNVSIDHIWAELIARLIPGATKSLGWHRTSATKGSRARPTSRESRTIRTSIKTRLEHQLLDDQLQVKKW